MKKYEEAELMVVRVDNAVICTSGCGGGNKDNKPEPGAIYNSGSDMWAYPTEIL